MANVFIIHGSFGSPFENWFPWLDRTLGEDGIKTYVPHFPTPECQSYSSWAELLGGYERVGLLNEETVVVGHSLGPVFAARYAVERGLHLRGIVSVCGFNNYESGNQAFDAVNRSFFVADECLATARQAFSSRSCFVSGEDPYLPQEILGSFATLLGATLHEVEHGGHFNEAAGYVEFPELAGCVRGQLAL
jgi:serine hydrolase